MRSSSAVTIPMTCSNQTDNALLHHQNEKNAMRNIVIHKIPGYIGTVIYIYIITLALFPSITVQVQPLSSIDPPIFHSLHFLLFNIGDWIGRTFPIFECLQIFSPKHLLLWCLSRTLFIPLFLSCNISSSITTTPWISSDILFFFLLILFAISNGLLTSLVFMAAPKHHRITASEKPLVGSMMSFFLVVGLALGGLASFILD
jgi:equilibrative nucleoside transporter 1/2/3